MRKKDELMTLSEMLRIQFGEDTQSPIDVVNLALSIEQLNLIFYPMPSHISGMCIKAADLIAVNSTMTMGRQRFSLAHELYHYYYDNFETTICEKTFDGNKSDHEKEADQFASFFLMPSAALKKKILSIKIWSIKDFLVLEHFFQVSHEALKWRLVNCGALTKEQADSFSGIRKYAAMYGYPTNLYDPTPINRQKITLGSYIDLASILSEHELISEGKYHELLLDAFRADIVYGDVNAGDADED